MATPAPTAAPSSRFAGNGFALGSAAMILLFAVAPFVGIYPVFLMKALCFALFACAFNLLLGFGGLLSFGHAMFLGTAGYLAAHAAKVWGFTPELAILTGTAASAALGVVVGAASGGASSTGGFPGNNGSINSRPGSIPNNPTNPGATGWIGSR